MRVWFFGIILCAIGGGSCYRSSATPDEIKKQKLANEVRSRAALKIKKETGLCPIGTIGQMLNKVEVLGLTFYYYQLIDIEEGRRLLVKAVDIFMNEVNKEIRIRPYLVQYPFAPKNIEISILIRNPDCGSPPLGHLWGAKAVNGDFRYKIESSKNHMLTEIYKETYDEALERIKDPSLPPVAFHPALEISQEELEELGKSILFVGDDGEVHRPSDMHVK